MTATEPGRENEQAFYSMPVSLPEMGGDGWSVDVPEGEAVTFDWGNGDYGIHLTRDGCDIFEVKVNVLHPHDHMSEAFQKLARVICEQIPAAEVIRMRSNVTYY